MGNLNHTCTCVWNAFHSYELWNTISLVLKPKAVWFNDLELSFSHCHVSIMVPVFIFDRKYSRIASSSSSIFWKILPLRKWDMYLFKGISWIVSLLVWAVCSLALSWSNSAHWTLLRFKTCFSKNNTKSFKLFSIQLNIDSLFV